MKRMLLSSTIVAGVAAAGLGLLAPTAANASTAGTSHPSITVQTLKSDAVHPDYSGVVCLDGFGCLGGSIPHTWYLSGVCGVTAVENGNNWVAFEANGRYYPGTGPGTVTRVPAPGCVTEVWVDTPAG